MMSRFDDYRDKYKHAKLERRNGILQLAFNIMIGPEMV